MYINCLALKSFWFWPQRPQISLNLKSDDLENRFSLTKGSKASFWYIISPGLKMFWFWSQLIPNIPNYQFYDLKWPRPLFRDQRTKSFILVNNLSRFENFCNLTPNDPNPQFAKSKIFIRSLASIWAFPSLYWSSRNLQN